MDHRSILGVALLLMGASCVPPPLASRAAAVTKPLRPAAPAKRAPPVSVAAAKPLAPQIAMPTRQIAAPLPPAGAAPFVVAADAGDQIGRSLECLTAAVYYEARSETVEGQRAVAQVVLNRVRHPAFPDSICGVVYQGSARRTGCQFSFTCDGSLRGPREPYAWQRARTIAGEALNGHVYPRVGLATHYHTTSTRAWWASSLTASAIVGAHRFYRWAGGAGRPGAFSQRYSGVEYTAEPAEAQEARPARAVFSFPGGTPVRVHRLGSATAAPDRVATEAGVTVRRGMPEQATLPTSSDVESGVRIHRAAFPDGGPIASEPAALASPASPQA